MTLYTNMPLELVLDGIQSERGPYAEVRIGAVLLQVEPIHPGIGKIVRLLDGPLNSYLMLELQPGRLVSYGGLPKQL